MESQHLMKFTLRQMERERKRSLQLKKKKAQMNFGDFMFKKFLLRLKSKLL